MRRGRTFLKTMAWVAFAALSSLIVVTGLFEVYLRHMGYLEVQPANYPCISGDPDLNHVFEPNCEGVAPAAALRTEKDVTYKTNAIGIRGPMPEKGKSLAVVIGDSYTEGFGLEEWETLPFRLNAELNAIGIKDIQVLNGGVMGYSPLLYPKHFARKFAELRPAFTLLNLDFSDFNDDSYLAQVADYDASGRPVTFPGREFFPQWLLPYVYSNRSAVLRLIHSEVNRWKQIQLREQNFVRMNEWVGKSARLFSDEELEEAKLAGCRKAFELTGRAVLDLKSAVEKAGGRLAMHMYPPGAITKPLPEKVRFSISLVNHWDEWTRKDYSWNCGVGPSVVDLFAKFAARQGIPFFNSLPLLANRPDKANLYFEHDAHWNSRGVALVAKTLAPALAAEFRKGKK